MLLKAGFLRLAGHADEDPVSMATLWGYAGQKPTSTARSLGLAGASNLHDLTTWVNLIVAFRRSGSLVYPDANFAASLIANVAVVSDRWNETLRYRKNVAYVHEMNRVRTSCGWMMDHHGTI